QRLCGDADRWVEGQAVARHDATARVRLKVPGARVGERSIFSLDREEAVPFDREVEGVARGQEGPLFVDVDGASNAHAAAELNAERRLSRLTGRRAGLTNHLVEKILKLDALALEADGAGVRNVVGDPLEAGLLCRHSSRSNVK